jgi:hypothetical protein
MRGVAANVSHRTLVEMRLIGHDITLEHEQQIGTGYLQLQLCLKNPTVTLSQWNSV